MLLQWQDASFQTIIIEVILALYSACMEMSIATMTAMQTSINPGREMKDQESSRHQLLNCFDFTPQET